MIDIEKLQKLSALDLSEESKILVEKSLEGVIAMMGQVDSLDIEALKSASLEPIAHVSPTMSSPLSTRTITSTPSEFFETPSPPSSLLIDKKSAQTIEALPIEDGMFLAPKAIKK